MVLGSVGTGKSRFLNILSGVDLDEVEPFESDYNITGCTKDPQWIPFEHFNLLDTPGLNNDRIPTADWAQRLNDWSAAQNGGQLSVDLTVLIFKQKPRPDIADSNCLAVLQNTIAECKLNNLCVVFTFCDQVNTKKKLRPGEKRFDKAYVHDWFNNALRTDVQGNTIPGIPEIP